MPHAIADADWPWVRRLIQDYKAGRLTRRPKGVVRPGGGHGRGLKLGRAIEPIEQGKTGKIVRMQGKKGEEKPVGTPFDAFNRFGDLEAEQELLYATVGHGKEIVQSWCADNEETANDKVA